MCFPQRKNFVRFVETVGTRENVKMLVATGDKEKTGWENGIGHAPISV